MMKSHSKAYRRSLKPTANTHTHMHIRKHTRLLLSPLYSQLISHPPPSILFRSHFTSFTVLLSNALPWCAMLREMAAEQTGESHFVITKNHLWASTCSLAPFCFSSDRSPRCFSVTNPPPAGAILCSEMSNCHPLVDKCWRRLQSERSGQIAQDRRSGKVMWEGNREVPSSSWPVNLKRDYWSTGCPIWAEPPLFRS